MAEDLRLYSDFFQNAKTQLLRRRLGSDGVLALLRFWCAVADGYPDGNLAGKSDEFLEIMADWTGEPGLFAATLREIGFLDGDERQSRLHNWAKRQPWVVERPKRSAKAQKAANARHRKSADNSQRDDLLSIARSKGTHTEAEKRALFEICGRVCARCNGDGATTWDHIIPITKTEDPRASDSIDNLQPLCQSCQSAKGTDEIDFRPPNWKRLLPETIRCAPSMLQACSEHAQSNAPTHPAHLEAKPKSKDVFPLRRPVQAVGS